MEDKIREAFEDKTKEFNFSKRTSKDKALGWFRKGYKSASAELEKQIEKMKCCGNCKEFDVCMLEGNNVCRNWELKDVE